MDSTRRLAILRAQIDEAQGGHPDDFEAWKHRTGAAIRIAMGASHPALTAFEAVRYRLPMVTSSTPQSAFDAARTRGVRDAVAVLEGAIHEISVSEPATSAVEVAGLHPWVAGAAAGLWDDGHHRQAVDEATRAIEVRLKAKLGTHQTGTPLVTEAFSTTAPRAGQPRLRFLEFEEGTPTWTNAHEGAMAFGRGCMLRIRNILEHHDGEMERQVAIECLAALSLLARWVDKATVVIAAD